MSFLSSKEKQVIILIAIILLALTAGGMVGCPMYSVWQQGLVGQAALNRAVQTRKILVQQAQAERDSAVLRAEAISIVGKAAQDFPEYRYQEFLGAFGEALHNGTISQIIYVPTEAGIPIMEASKRK